MKVSTVTDIRQIILQTRAGVSQRQIAESLGVARNTVSGYQKQARERGWLEPGSAMPGDAMIAAACMTALPQQNSSKLSEQAGWIAERLGAGASVSKIWQELKEERATPCGYASVWAYVRQLRGPSADVTVPVETAPGEEAQVDFGYAGAMYDPEREKLRKAWVFVMTLGYSRHQFARFVFDQSSESWLRLHREAFEFFGGVPGRVKLDNLKAAIVRASVDDPVVQKAYRDLAEHYGFLISPCRVATPQHKGKVESGVKYVKNNFLKGARARYLSAERHIGQANADLRAWVLGTAGLREHGTTHWQPLEQFKRVECAQLRTLPETPYEIAFWTQAKLGRDCHFSLESSHYSAPFRFAGQTLDLRVSERQIQVYVRHEHVATHTRQRDKGRRSTDVAHLPTFKAIGLVTRPVLIEKAADIGPYTALLAEKLLEDRPVDRRAVVQRLIGLIHKHDKAVLERACKAAVECGDPSPQTVRNMIKLVASGQIEAGTTSSASPETTPTALYARNIDELLPGAESIIESPRYRAGFGQAVSA